MGNSKTWKYPRVFIIHINDPPLTINTLSEPSLFADDTSVIISSKNSDDFSVKSNTVLSLSLSHISKWFTSNKLVLNVHKYKIITFITNKSAQYDLKVIYDDKYIKVNIYKIPWSTN
jgi:hypothetical protein